MLINCSVYKAGKKVGDNIDVTAISDHLSAVDEFVWVALKDPDADELAAMKEEFDLHPLAVEDALHGHQRPKLEEYGSDLFAVLHVPQFENDGNHQLGEVMIFVGRNYVLTIRRNVEPGFSSVRARTEREPELLKHGSGFVFYAVMDATVDRYFPIVEQLETELEELESKIFTRKSMKRTLRDVYTLKAKVVMLRHAVVPLMEAVGKLQGGRVPQVCLGTQEYFRDVVDHLARINAAIDDLREMLTTALSVNLSVTAAESGETSKKLAAWAAMLAVPTVMAGIWGMNFENMPELKWKYGYPVALALIGGVVVYLYYRFKKARWL